jgi:hypothetical protein
MAERTREIFSPSRSPKWEVKVKKTVESAIIFDKKCIAKI